MEKGNKGQYIKIRRVEMDLSQAALGYKIALIQIEKALVDIARDRGDVPKSMSYDDAREAILDKKYPYREVLRRAEESEIAANDEFKQLEESRRKSL